MVTLTRSYPYSSSCEFLVQNSMHRSSSLANFSAYLANFSWSAISWLEGVAHVPAFRSVSRRGVINARSTSTLYKTTLTLPYPNALSVIRLDIDQYLPPIYCNERTCAYLSVLSNCSALLKQEILPECRPNWIQYGA